MNYKDIRIHNRNLTEEFNKKIINDKFREIFFINKRISIKITLK